MHLVERHCPLCKPGVRKRVKFEPRFDPAAITPEIFSARQADKKIHFQIVECERCKMWISDPSLPSDILFEMYEKAAHHYDDLESFIRGAYRKVLLPLLKEVPTRNRFIDIGGGNGFLLDLECLSNFKEKYVLELSRSAETAFEKRKSAGNFLRSSLKSGVFEKNSVSVASCFHVLDHLSDPLSFLKELYEVLEPGGGVASVVHNTKAMSARVLGRRTPILGAWHTYLYNPHNIKELFEKIGFTKVKVKPISNQYPLWYWAENLPLGTPLKQKSKQILESLRMKNVPLPAYFGNMSVTAFKP